MLLLQSGALWSGYGGRGHSPGEQIALDFWRDMHRGLLPRWLSGKQRGQGRCCHQQRQAPRNNPDKNSPILHQQAPPFPVKVTDMLLYFTIFFSLCKHRERFFVGLGGLRVCLKKGKRPLSTCCGCLLHEKSWLTGRVAWGSLLEAGQFWTRFVISSRFKPAPAGKNRGGAWEKRPVSERFFRVCSVFCRAG